MWKRQQLFATDGQMTPSAETAEISVEELMIIMYAIGTSHQRLRKSASFSLFRTDASDVADESAGHRLIIDTKSRL